MNARDFCYWLQGFFELSSAGDGERSGGLAASTVPLIDNKKAVVIKRHLDMVFKHEIDPSHGDPVHQQELTAAHEGQPWQEHIDKLTGEQIEKILKDPTTRPYGDPYQALVRRYIVLRGGASGVLPKPKTCRHHRHPDRLILRC